ncbi:hypothetical protein XELAEV_18042764mg [Xenopus laevis]|uniref:Uncharacterized protein n=1 Tax=Xenopus laevis TaxID=8355 RepID=A0A974H6B2_XENLA|nr:hypothetical protein XELAEV_18042764mg [Xenopus laevis]
MTWVLLRQTITCCNITQVFCLDLHLFLYGINIARHIFCKKEQINHKILPKIFALKSIGLVAEVQMGWFLA